MVDLKKSLDNNYFPIVPSDTERLRVPVDMIWVGTAGDLVVLNAQDEVVTFVGASGWMHVPGCTRVLAATTAEALIGMASKALR